jgi:hypothetical protein
MTVWTSAITPVHLILANKLFSNKEIEISAINIFLFINFETPLYFSHFLKQKEGIADVIA